MLYKLENGEIRRAPRNGILNGQGVSNLDKLFEADSALAAAHGYYPLISQEAPQFNEETQHLQATYTFENGHIYRSWEIAYNE